MLVAKMIKEESFFPMVLMKKKNDCTQVHLGINYNKIRKTFLFRLFRLLSLYRTKYFVDSRAAFSFLVSYR